MLLYTPCSCTPHAPVHPMPRVNPMSLSHFKVGHSFIPFHRPPQDLKTWRLRQDCEMYSTDMNRRTSLDNSALERDMILRNLKTLQTSAGVPAPAAAAAAGAAAAATKAAALGPSISPRAAMRPGPQQAAQPFDDRQRGGCMLPCTSMIYPLASVLWGPLRPPPHPWTTAQYLVYTRGSTPDAQHFDPHRRVRPRFVVHVAPRVGHQSPTDLAAVPRPPGQGPGPRSDICSSHLPEAIILADRGTAHCGPGEPAPTADPCS